MIVCSLWLDRCTNGGPELPEATSKAAVICIRPINHIFNFLNRSITMLS